MRLSVDFSTETLGQIEVETFIQVLLKREKSANEDTQPSKKITFRIEGSKVLRQARIKRIQQY